MIRRAIQIFIGVWIAVQIVVPIGYYAWRRDKNDERFAWRMFSPTRMMTCDPTFEVNGEKAPLASLFHEGWIEIAKRGRFEVLEAMGARLCELNKGKEVRLDLQCKTVDNKTEHWGGSDLCKFPHL